jgi:hypothetical protein
MCANFCTPTYPIFGVEYSTEVRVYEEKVIVSQTDFHSVTVAQHYKQEAYRLRQVTAP